MMSGQRLLPLAANWYFRPTSDTRQVNSKAPNQSLVRVGIMVQAVAAGRSQRWLTLICAGVHVLSEVE